MFHNHAMGPVDDLTKAMIAPLIQRAALTLAFNEAWIVIAALFGLSLLLLPLLKQVHMKRSALGPGT
jgi:DHA2 family multidrug resistance protein